MADRTILKLPRQKGRRLWPFRKGARRGVHRHITAMDVDGQTLRVVQTQPRGKGITVTRIAVERLDLPEAADRSNPEVMGRAIAQALSRLRIKPTPVIMGIPRALVVLRTLSLPAIDDLRELASMVHFQIAKELPFRLEEAVIDFKVRQRQGAADTEFTPPVSPDEGKGENDLQSKLDVLVAAVKRDVIQYYLKLTVAAGLKLRALGFRPYANARCVEACRLAEGGEGVAFVSLRPDEVLVDVIAQGDLVFSRGSALHWQAGSALAAPPDAESSLDSFAEPFPSAETGTRASTAEEQANLVEAVTIEVVRSFHSFGGMALSSPVAKLVVAGATGHERALVESLQKRLSVPCTLLEPAEALDLPLAARGYASGAIAALGLALGMHDPAGMPFDFLNPKRPAVRRNLRRIRTLSGLAAAAVLVLVLAVVEYLLIQGRERVKQDLEAKLAVESKRLDTYRRMRAQAMALDRWAKEGRNWLAPFAHLSAILPPSEELYVTALSVKSSGLITLSVQARSAEILDQLDRRLRDAGYEVRPLAVKPGPDRFGYLFRSSVDLILPDKLEIDLSKVKPPARPADDGSLDPALWKKGGS